MSGKPDGKRRATKKNGPVRKLAAVIQRREAVLSDALIKEARESVTRVVK